MESNFIHSNQGLGGYSPGQRTLKNTGKPYMSGQDVKYVQKKVGVAVDGLYGPRTQSGVMAFQSKHGLNASGIVDGATWNALQNKSGSILGEDFDHFLDWVTGKTKGMSTIDQIMSPGNPLNQPDDSSSKSNHKWLWIGGGIATAGLLGMLAASGGGSKK
jgi:peptidoglycan hydrolase-like protein with peptidoglycan-binding domain